MWEISLSYFKLNNLDELSVGSIEETVWRLSVECVESTHRENGDTPSTCSRRGILYRVLPLQSVSRDQFRFRMKQKKENRGPLLLHLIKRESR